MKGDERSKGRGVAWRTHILTKKRKSKKQKVLDLYDTLFTVVARKSCVPKKLSR